MILKGLVLDVYKDTKRSCDCTNGGISSRYDTIIFVDPNKPDLGWVDVDTENPQENVVLLSKRRVGDNEYMSLQPIDSCHIKCPFYHGETHWYMAGGNFAYACDSRYTDYCNYPLPIHDRREW